MIQSELREIRQEITDNFNKVLYSLSTKQELIYLNSLIASALVPVRVNIIKGDASNLSTSLEEDKQPNSFDVSTINSNHLDKNKLNNHYNLTRTSKEDDSNLSSTLEEDNSNLSAYSKDVKSNLSTSLEEENDFIYADEEIDLGDDIGFNNEEIDTLETLIDSSNEIEFLLSNPELLNIAAERNPYVKSIKDIIGSSETFELEDKLSDESLGKGSECHLKKLYNIKKQLESILNDIDKEGLKLELKI